MNSHRKLLAWQACRELTAEVYRATRTFPRDERFGLTNQLRRAAVSATANIAEGYARSGPRETAHGLSISLGSLAEVDALLAVSEDLGYLNAEQFVMLETRRRSASRLTFGLLRAVKRQTG